MCIRDRVWFGLYSIDAHHIRAGRQSKKGVRVGQHFFPGAFKQSIYTSDRKVWIRKSSKHYDPNMYPNRGGRAPSDFSENARGRFPVVKARVALQEAENVFVHWVAKMEAYLANLDRRELVIEMRKAKGVG